MNKTNAMRYLDSLDISYEVSEYSSEDGKIDGISVAGKLGVSSDEIYKTLVLKGRDIFVSVIPVDKELDLKVMAKLLNEKKVNMVPVRDIHGLTGYVRGGCSPFAMKKKYPMYIQKDILSKDFIRVSGGKVGVQIKLSVKDFLTATEAEPVAMVLD